MCRLESWDPALLDISCQDHAVALCVAGIIDHAVARLLALVGTIAVFGGAPRVEVLGIVAIPYAAALCVAGIVDDVVARLLALAGTVSVFGELLVLLQFLMLLLDFLLLLPTSTLPINFWVLRSW